MIGRVAALVIWIACYYYGIWDIIPEGDHAILAIGLLLLFFWGDEPIIAYYKKTVKKIYKSEEDEDDE